MDIVFPYNHMLSPGCMAHVVSPADLEVDLLVKKKLKRGEGVPKINSAVHMVVRTDAEKVKTKRKIKRLERMLRPKDELGWE